MVAVSCNDDDTKDEDIPVTEIKVTPATGSVVAGTTLTLKAEILPENATDKNVKWKSRDENVATVDEATGVVTGVTEGEAVIMALCGGKNGQAVITVTPAPIRVEKIELSKTELALFVGKTEKLTYTINPENATNQEAAWDSSDKTVATIADDGTVTALAEGTTDITLTIDEKTVTCKVTVSSPAIEGITIPYLSAIQGNTVTMTAAGFKAGDKVKIEAVAGDEYSAEADVANVTAQNATFELPAGRIARPFLQADRPARRREAGRGIPAPRRSVRSHSLPPGLLSDRRGRSGARRSLHACQRRGCYPPRLHAGQDRRLQRGDQRVPGMEKGCRPRRLHRRDARPHLCHGSHLDQTPDRSLRASDEREPRLRRQFVARVARHDPVPQRHAAARLGRRRGRGSTRSQASISAPIPTTNTPAK